MFFLANAVDDVDMHITHVLRGEDLIDSTHRVLLALRQRSCDDDHADLRAHAAHSRSGWRQSCRKRFGAVSVEGTATPDISTALMNYLRCSVGDRKMAAKF